MKTGLSILIAIVLLCTSCSTLRIEKRRYQNGWHVDRVAQDRTSSPSVAKINLDSAEAIVANPVVKEEDNPVAAKQEELVVFAVPMEQSNQVQPQPNSFNDSTSKTRADFHKHKGIGLGKQEQVAAQKNNTQQRSSAGDFSEPKFWKACLLTAFILIATSGLLLFGFPSILSLITWLGIVFILAGSFALLTALISYLCRKEINPHLHPDPNTGEVLKSEKITVWILYSLGALLMSVALGFIGIFGLAFIALS